MGENAVSAELWLLADDVASCRYSPPLTPTMKAVLRALKAAGEEVTSTFLYSVIPCSCEATRRQLSRLMKVGWVERVRCEGGGARVFYRLTPAGLVVVNEWEADVRRALSRIRHANLGVL